MTLGRKSIFIELTFGDTKIFIQANKNLGICDIFDSNNHRYLNLLNEVAGRQFNSVEVTNYILAKLIEK